LKNSFNFLMGKEDSLVGKVSDVLVCFIFETYKNKNI